MRIKSLLVVGLLLWTAPHTFGQTIVLRVGAFPNITHSQTAIQMGLNAGDIIATH